MTVAVDVIAALANLTRAEKECAIELCRCSLPDCRGPLDALLLTRSGGPIGAGAFPLCVACLRRAAAALEAA